MAVSKIFVRISILIILNVHLRSSFVYSLLIKTKKFSNDLNLELGDVNTHFPQKFSSESSIKMGINSEHGDVLKQNCNDLEIMCVIARNQSDYTNPNRATAIDFSTAIEIPPNSLTLVKEKCQRKNIRNTTYSKLLYKCSDTAQESNVNDVPEIEISTIFELYIAPSDGVPGRAVVFESTANVGEVKFIGTVKEVYFFIEGQSSKLLSCCAL